jgi:hypothetical protein
MQPDNKVTRVTYGLLNLTHRDGDADPVAMDPGRRYRVRVRLNDIAQTFPRGHRLRIAISSSYFPLAWPPPRSARLTIHTRNSRLTLPVREPRDDVFSFYDAQGAATGTRHQIQSGEQAWRVIRNLDSDTATLEVIQDSGIYRLEDVDITMRRRAEERYSYCADDFSSARGETLWTRTVERGEWKIKTVTRTVLRSNESHFLLDAELDAYEGEIRVFSKNWNLQIERDFV